MIDPAPALPSPDVLLVVFAAAVIFALGLVVGLAIDAALVRRARRQAAFWIRAFETSDRLRVQEKAAVAHILHNARAAAGPATENHHQGT